MPWAAASDLVRWITNGKARPSACGQAITRTVTAIFVAKLTPRKGNQTIKAISAITKAIQKSHEATRSAIVSTRDFALCDITSVCCNWPRNEAAPTWVSWINNEPLPLIVPPTTLLCLCLSIKRLSPVINDSSTWLWPLTTTPSAGKASPASTWTIMSDFRLLIGMSIIWLSCLTWAVWGRRACNFAVASPACIVAVISIRWPSNIITVSVANSQRKSIICDVWKNWFIKTA
ncbi:hypothetical protein Q604_UNBc4C00066G0001 [human gut metagenome]|uniref:Uncharacterized protein n=1 Tax=human gut metagenome TaxID=408170 RepID=W1WDT4_9ZZZZ